MLLTLLAIIAVCAVSVTAMLACLVLRLRGVHLPSVAIDIKQMLRARRERPTVRGFGGR
jgi:hypothetical protein